VGVNAVIENKGARVAVIITEGFRDALELRRGQRRQAARWTTS
jgi:N-methylhydantoinase A